MNTEKPETLLDVSTRYARAAEVYAQIDGILSTADALGDMIRNLTRCANAAGVNVSSTIAEFPDDLHQLREEFTRVRNAASGSATKCRDILGQSDRREIADYIKSLSPAALVDLIRSTK